MIDVKQGMSTADNERFLKLWYEVLYNKIGFQIKSREEAKNSKKKWFPYNKGGEFRKWYGNNDYVVNWENDGVELKNFAGSVIRNPEYFFQDGMEYSTISSSKISFRKFDFGFILGGGSSAIYKCKNQDYICGLVNSSIINNILLFLSPTLNFSNGIIALIPVIIKNTDEISRIVESNIEISKDDWDSFETSWDFETHPLLRFKENGKIADSFSKWQQYKQEQFDKLKANEEELNRLFIEIYGLQDEMTPEVADKDITVSLADETREIKSLLSYAVGCMLGRYSLDKNGRKRISPLFVLPQYRNKGIAPKAMSELEKTFGKENWELETILTEKVSRHLYEKMGYHLSGKTTIVNDKLTLVSYRK